MLRIFLGLVLVALIWYDFTHQDYFVAPQTRSAEQIETLKQTSPYVKKVVGNGVKVIDGDGFFLKGREIRLHAIDAPELSQTCFKPNNQEWECGEQASLELEKMLGNANVNCEVKTVDTFNRLIATCFLNKNGTTININKYMVEKGWAFAYTQYSKQYVKEQKMAQRAKIGIWNGKCIPPWKWRALSNV